jgi:hypothetical protein
MDNLEQKYFPEIKKIRRKKGGANKLKILKLMKLREKLKYIKKSLEKTKRNLEQLAFMRG